MFSVGTRAPNVSHEDMRMKLKDEIERVGAVTWLVSRRHDTLEYLGQ